MENKKLRRINRLQAEIKKDTNTLRECKYAKKEVWRADLGSIYIKDCDHIFGRGSCYLFLDYEMVGEVIDMYMRAVKRLKKRIQENKKELRNLTK